MGTGSINIIFPLAAMRVIVTSLAWRWLACRGQYGGCCLAPMRQWMLSPWLFPWPPSMLLSLIFRVITLLRREEKILEPDEGTPPDSRATPFSLRD
nr:hypothetical protein [Sodalis-like endosymbiont of Proechinophthirus fluctus]